MQPIIFAFATFTSTLLGGIVGLRNRHRMHLIMSFTAGILLGVCFFDILPEIFELIGTTSSSVTYPLLMVVVGFLLFHIMEKAAVIQHSHEEDFSEHKHPTVGLVAAAGLSFHSLLDGVGIGLAFHVSPHLGIIVALAVMAHDFSDGLNTVTLMLVNKNTIRKSIGLLLIDSIAPVLGVLSTFIFSIPENVLVLYLGFFMGFLLYIGASELLPEAHSKHSSWGMVALTILGAAFIFAATRLS